MADEEQADEEPQPQTPPKKKSNLWMIIVIAVLGFFAIILIVMAAVFIGDLSGPGTNMGLVKNGAGCGDVMSAAEQYLNIGIKYKKTAQHCGPEGTGPTGVITLDCSGYASRSYHDAGQLPDSGYYSWCKDTLGIATASFYTRVAKSVDEAKSVLQPGDIMLFGMGSNPDKPQKTGDSHAVIFGGFSGSQEIIYESGGRGGGPHRSVYNVFGGGRDLYGVYRTSGCTNPTSSGGKVVTLDPGHPSEVSDGTSNPSLGITEKQVVFDVALKTKSILESKGIKVVMTKSSVNEKVTNQVRAEIANKAGSALFFRIHADATKSKAFFIEYPTKTGKNSAGVTGPPASVLAPSKDAATKISAAVAQATGLTNLGLRDEASSPTAAANGGVLIGSLYSKVPTATIEMIGMLDDNNAKWIADLNNQQKMAQGIANGILEFLK